MNRINPSPQAELKTLQSEREIYLSPITGFPVDESMAIRFRIRTLSLVTLTCECVVRVWRSNRWEYTPIQREISVTSLVSDTNISIQLTKGELISVTANVAGASGFFGGQTYVTAFLGKGVVNSVGAITNFIRYTVLFSDFLNSLTPISYPQTKINTDLPKFGTLQYLTIGNPGAGSNFQITLPSNNTVYKIRSLKARIATNATVANRLPGINITHSVVGVMYASQSYTNIPASQTIDFSWAMGLSGNYTTVFFTSENALPDTFFMSDGGSTTQINGTCTGLQAGDQWSLINYVLEVWVKPDTTPV